MKNENEIKKPAYDSPTADCIHIIPCRMASKKAREAGRPITRGCTKQCPNYISMEELEEAVRSASVGMPSRWCEDIEYKYDLFLSDFDVITYELNELVERIKHPFEKREQ